jgi:hypothetical protein
MAVVGFDDIALARHLSPPLTTVHVDAFQLGERAIQRLLRRDTGEPAPSRSHEVLPTWLVVRESCGATPREGRRSTDARNGPAANPARGAAKTRRRERGA